MSLGINLIFTFDAQLVTSGYYAGHYSWDLDVESIVDDCRIVWDVASCYGMQCVYEACNRANQALEQLGHYDDFVELAFVSIRSPKTVATTKGGAL